MSESYGASSIQVLKGLEAVQKRPGMYIGSTGLDGLHHCVWEIISNSVDEAMGGHCKKIVTIIHPDGSVSVEDNGRGIPVEIHPEEGITALELVLTKLHAGGKFSDEEGGYKASGGLHGVGISVVNALSKKLVATVWRDSNEFQMSFSKGISTTVLIPKGKKKKRGTKIQFWPDPEIFPETKFDYETVKTRIHELSFLNPGCTFVIEKGKESTVFLSKTGLPEYIEYLESTEGITNTIMASGESEGIQVDIALKWTTKHTEKEMSFCNNINTHEGGTHLTGFRTALSNAITKFVLKDVKARCTPNSDDFKEGMTAILSVRVPQPQFEGQTKTKLGTAAARTAVNKVVFERLSDIFDNDSKLCAKLAERIILTAKAREAAQRARDATRKAAGITSDMLPGKLTDCQSSDITENEIFIVEGDSAGGSAKQGRDRKFQAILPLKGKILNVEGMAMSKLIKSKEIQTMVAAIGTGLGGFDIKKLRYGKIIIMTDADVDGSHIRTLILTFFFRQMPELIFGGHLFIACPPLFKVKVKGKDVYLHQEKELKAVLAEMPDGRPRVSRYKGLGEMPPQLLWETTMNPDTRKLIEVTIPDAVEADKTFTTLMGNLPEARAKFISENSIKIDS